MNKYLHLSSSSQGIHKTTELALHTAVTIPYSIKGFTNELHSEYFRTPFQYSSHDDTNLKISLIPDDHGHLKHTNTFFHNIVFKAHVLFQEMNVCMMLYE